MISPKVLTYGDSELECVAEFKFEKSNPKTLIFIHGGAWRDPNNTWDDFREMATQLNEMDSQLNLFSVNYRLSPTFKHPIHLLDTLRALVYISKCYGIEEKEIFLLGHSAGATLALQLMSIDQMLQAGLRGAKNGGLAEKELEAYDINELIRSFEAMQVKSLFFVDGIFDIVDLLDEYPDYKSFIDDAFISEEHYRLASQLSCSSEISFPNAKGIHFNIIHSLDDELLTMRQSEHVCAFLKPKVGNLRMFTGHWGPHERVYRNRKVSKIIVDNL